MHSIAASPAGERPRLRTRLASLSLTDAATVVVFALVGSLMLVPTKDPDLFWHLATGRWIVRHHRVPHVDPFSWTAKGRGWIAHEWLTETLFWGLHRLGGYAALSIAVTAVVTTAMWLTWRTMRRLGVGGGAAALLTLIGALAALPTWAVRPQMLSFALVAVVVSITTEAWRDPSTLRRLWVLPPLALVWANLHGGYIFGIAVLGAFAVGTTAEVLLAKRRGRLLEERVLLARTAWLATVACIVATLVNPNGIAGFTYPFSYLGDNASTRYVTEWFAPDFSKPDYWALALLLVGAAFAFVRGRRSMPIHAWLQVGALSFLAVQSIRNASPFVAVALPWIASGLTRGGATATATAATTTAATTTSRRGTPAGAGVVHLVLVVAALLVVGVNGGTQVAAPHQDASHRATFPVAATAWMLDHPRANVLNRYDWGGYLILAAPSLPVSVDGRPDMYGDAFMDRYVSIWQTRAGWQDRLRDDGYQRVIGAADDPIVAALQRQGDARWHVVYRDDVATILDRTP